MKYAPLALLALALATGCLKIAPADGALHCSTVGQQCPGGYHCASDNTCWHDGHDPVTVSDDMSVPDDLAGAGGGGGSDGGMSVAFCMVPSDCPVPPQPCLLAACVQTVCGTVAAPAGTKPPSAQVKGDCQQRVCDNGGNVVVMPDSTNVPTDPTGGCVTEGCNGATPTMSSTASGTACTQTANGVCNGAGVCGVCKPATSRCMGLTIQNCSTQGQWVNGNTCPNACTNGMCTGACNPANNPPYCTGTDQLNTCVNSQWSQTTCTYACSGMPGACTGTCKPSAKTCSGNNVSWCDATGTPQSMACGGATPVCLNGACVACSPGAVGCCTTSSNLAGNQTCDSNGNWGACNACGGNSYYSCSGAGACACTGAPSPCKSNDACGSRTDACGAVQSCGSGCADTQVCAYNSSLDYYYCKTVTTTTTGTCCGTSSACCGKYCC